MAVIDPSIDLDIVTFKALIEQCKRDQSYDALLARLQIVFSSLSRLSMSFADVGGGPFSVFLQRNGGDIKSNVHR